MKFRAILTDETGRVWVEDHEANTEDPERYMNFALSQFHMVNPKHPKRALIKVFETPWGTNDHRWVFRKEDRSEGVPFDRMKCDCGVTAKRFKNGNIVRDKTYGEDKFEFCKAREGEDNVTS